MAKSSHIAALVVLYYPRTHRARWVLPSTAWLLTKLDPRVEMIDESHPHFDAYAAIAGIKPEILTP